MRLKFLRPQIPRSVYIVQMATTASQVGEGGNQLNRKGDISAINTRDIMGPERGGKEANFSLSRRICSMEVSIEVIKYYCPICLNLCW